MGRLSSGTCQAPRGDLAPDRTGNRRRWEKAIRCSMGKRGFARGNRMPPDAALSTEQMWHKKATEWLGCCYVPRCAVPRRLWGIPPPDAPTAPAHRTTPRYGTVPVGLAKTGCPLWDIPGIFPAGNGRVGLAKSLAE